MDGKRCYLLSLGLALAVLGLASGCAGRDATSRLHALIEEAWSYRLQENPLLATAAGVDDYNDRLPSVTVADQERRGEQWRAFLERLEAIDRSQLAREDRINYDVFERDLRKRIADVEYKAYLMPITHEGGFHTAFARLPSQLALSTTRDYEDYIARLRVFPEYVDQQIALMERGIETGYTLPRVVLQGVGGTIEGHVVDDVAESRFYEPFASFPNAVPDSARARLREAGRAAVMDDVVPAYERLLAFVTQTYIPNARATIGASELPDGRAYYDALVAHYTTLDLTPEEVHRIGREEVKRIRAEMEAVIDEVGFRGDFDDFLRFLRTDPRFYADTPEALLKEAAYIAKRVDGKLPSLFHLRTLPRRPYGVEPVPDDLAPNYTGGRYVVAPVGSREAGTYWVNTYGLDSRPLYVLEALTMHEAVPGHHLQIALAQELGDVLPFRRFAGIAAFTEGWALYAERLGLEAGFYADPYSNFGRLTYEMWRACRLVVDTGMHAMGWSREQAMDYLASNTALSLHEVRTETDRYIAVPGQALAYKMGELKIRELRRQAEAALGPDFDVRDFHHAVLKNGAVPLPVLEEEVTRYVEGEGASG